MFNHYEKASVVMNIVMKTTLGVHHKNIHNTSVDFAPSSAL